MWMGQVYKAVHLTAFFSFLRVSNLVPHAEKSFSPAEQLAKGDVITSSDAVFLIIKWSKTMQTRDSVKIIKLPNLLQSPICPVRAINNMLILAPGQENHPLFQVKNENSKWVPLTDTRLRRNFAQILSRLGLQTSGISLHTFRRSGATLAFNSNVAIQNIQSHGTWTSDCFWRYIVQDQTASQQVADTFQRLLATPPVLQVSWGLVEVCIYLNLVGKILVIITVINKGHPILNHFNVYIYILSHGYLKVSKSHFKITLKCSYQP